MGISINNNELVKLAVAGSRDAYEKLVEANYDYVFKAAYKLSLSKEDAEDITHEVFIKLAKSIKTFRFDSKLTTWLCRIAINTHKDLVKSKAYRERSHEDISEKQIPDQRKPADSSSDIKKALKQLTPKLREAIVLVYYMGFSHKEAGEAMDCPEKTVSWRVHEAKKNLKELL